jgi:hypothetical protein
MLVNRCDLCGVEVEANRTGPPEGWNQVLGKELCAKCIRELEDWLRPKPRGIADYPGMGSKV